MRRNDVQYFYYGHLYHCSICYSYPDSLSAFKHEHFSVMHYSVGSELHENVQLMHAYYICTRGLEIYKVERLMKFQDFVVYKFLKLPHFIGSSSIPLSSLYEESLPLKVSSN
jgi:hypothetical protein